MNPHLVSDMFAFEVDLPLVGTQRAGAIVVFTMREHIVLADLDSAVNDLRRMHPSDHEVVIVLRPDLYDADSTALLQSVAADFGTSRLPVSALSIGRDRTLSRPSGDTASQLGDYAYFLEHAETYARLIFDEGLLAIFDGSDAVMRAAVGYHFETPKGKHIRTFIRAGNLFTSSALTAFAVCALLDRIELGEIKTILTDTSSINSFAYEVGRLQALYAPGTLPPTIHSIGATGHPSGVDRQALILVSVSFTGEYARTQSEVNPSARVISLVAISAEVLPNDRLLAPFQSGRLDDIDADARDWNDCPHCNPGNETVVKIGGEALIPLSPAVSSRMLTVDQAREWAHEHLEALVRLDPVVVHRSGRSADQGRRQSNDSPPNARTLYFELEAFFESAVDGSGEEGPVTALIESLRSKVDTLLSEMHPTHIVRPSDPSSVRLVDFVLSRMVDPPEVVALDDLRWPSASIAKHPAPNVLVVVAVSSTGRTLAQASKALRFLWSTPAPKLRFLVFMPRARDEQTWRYLKENLSIRSGKYDPRAVISVVEMWLPGERELEDSPWVAERDYWRSRIESMTGEARKQVRRRLDRLDPPTRPASLKHDLFLSSAAEIDSLESRLRLNETFAFWEFTYDPDVVSQATVYMTFAAILDWSRSLNGTKKQIAREPNSDRRFYDTSQRSHNVTILHPLNFDRFDDAVTQAALIRGSLDHELDYSASLVLSASMLTVLTRVIDEFEQSSESALAEFLLAIASGRLRLHLRHLPAFVERLPRSLPPVLSELASHLRELVAPLVAT